jgi:hypothetical protein
MRALNVVLPPQAPEETAQLLVEYTARNAEIIKVADIKLE